MKSTDTNLNNPCSIDNIDLHKTVSSLEFPNVVVTTQDLYDLMQVKDPLTIYVISDGKDRRIYYGETILSKANVDCKYLIGIDDKREYVLYMNIAEGYYDRLIPISRYKDPQDAVNALIISNNIGSTEKVDMQLYNSISAFIDGSVNVHDFIVGVLCIFGFKNDPRLSVVIDIGIGFGANHSSLDLPVIFREELPTLADRYNNNLFKLYSDIFNVVVKYDFFKDEKYHIGIQHLNLSSAISDFRNVYISSCE